MRSRQVFLQTAVFVAGLIIAAPINAMEAATAPDAQGSDRVLMRHLGQKRADQLAEIVQMQSQLNLILTCNTQGRFYAPGEAGADSDGCIPFTAQ